MSAAYEYRQFFIGRGAPARGQEIISEPLAPVGIQSRSRHFAEPAVSIHNQ